MPAPASQSKRSKRDFQMPPLPAGYSADSADNVGSVPPLPHGYTLDSPVTSDSNVPETDAGYSPLVSSRPTPPDATRMYTNKLPGEDKIASSVLELQKAKDDTEGLMQQKGESYEDFINRAAQAGQQFASGPASDIHLQKIDEANRERVPGTLIKAPLIGAGTAAAITGLGEMIPQTLGKVPGGRGPGGQMLPWGTEKTIGAGIGTAIAGGAKALGKADSIEKLAKFYLMNKLLNRIGLKGAQDIVP